ncbi:hypothetical protein A2U01_0031307, partial [Trifolium medium]|nr:hypothetical protein [Trifolium medium]
MLTPPSKRQLSRMLNHPLRSIDEEVVDVTIPPYVAVNDQMDVSEKVSTRPVAESVKEKTITPDVAQDAGASTAQTNLNTATITESFGDSSDSEDATEEEVGKDDLEIEDYTDVPENSPAEENKENNVSLGEEDTESEKTVAADQEPIDVDEVELTDEPQPNTVPEGIGR